VHPWTLTRERFRPMSTEPEPAVDDSYPPSWRPREAIERDNALNLTEAELWLGSLSPAELQAALLRARGGRS
jgi:hypothetical protein